MSGWSGGDRERLDAALLEAHAAGDLARLAALYAQAGAREAAAEALDPACFFWTQAWIFALDAGEEALARELEERLRSAGRLGGRS